MWLRWDTAAVVTIVLIAVSLVLGAASRPPPEFAPISRHAALAVMSDVAKELAVVLGLYAVWQKAGDLAVTGVSGATANADWIWRLEQNVHLPSEVSLQRTVIPHPLAVQSLNAFYAVVHVPALVVFLLWLYVRHRHSYPRWRNIGAVLTGAALLIQMIPVAPPRLLPGLGFVDTASMYGQSVYGPGGIGIAPQLAAMPSVHVAWAAFIALAVVRISKSRWRWLILLHPIATTLAVVATGNHWWLDGIVAVALLPVALAVEAAASGLASRLRVSRLRVPPQTPFSEVEVGRDGPRHGGREPERAGRVHRASAVGESVDGTEMDAIA